MRENDSLDHVDIKQIQEDKNSGMAHSAIMADATFFDIYASGVVYSAITADATFLNNSVIKRFKSGSFRNLG